MTRPIQMFVGALLLGVVMNIAVASFGQDRTRELQSLIDGPRRVIDLGGQRWEIKRLTISPAASGKTLRNGWIAYGGPDGKPQYYLIEIVQGRKWNGVTYPVGKTDVQLQHVVLDGAFTFDCAFQEHNEKEATRQRKDFNLIGSMTNKAGDVVLENCSFIHCGGSGWGGPADSLKITNCEAVQVSKHVVACPGFGGMKVFIDGLTTINCGNSFDLSNPDKSPSKLLQPDIAIIRNVKAFDNRGRTKIASPNWFAKFEDLYFQQSNVVNMNLFPALDAAYNSLHVSIDGFTAINFAAQGFGSLADAANNDGLIEIQNARFRNCFSAAKVQQRMRLSNVVIDGCYQKYQSGTPSERNVTVVHPQSAQHWAGVYDQIEDLYDHFNVRYGTNYQPAYWVPPEVRVLMVHQ